MWFRLTLEWFGYSHFGLFALSIVQLLRVCHLHLQEVCFYVFLKCLKCLGCSLYTFNALCFEMVVVYAWIYLCQQVVLSPGMFDPRQFLSNIYFHQNVLILSLGVFDPRQFVYSLIFMFVMVCWYIKFGDDKSPKYFV